MKEQNGLAGSAGAVIPKVKASENRLGAHIADSFNGSVQRRFALKRLMRTGPLWYSTYSFNSRGICLRHIGMVCSVHSRQHSVAVMGPGAAHVPHRTTS